MGVESRLQHGESSGAYVVNVFEYAVDMAELITTLALHVALSALVPRVLVEWMRGGFAVRVVGVMAVLGTVMAMWPVQQYPVLLAMMCVWGAGLFYLHRIAVAVSVAEGTGLARVKLLGTCGGQAIQLAVLFLPALTTLVPLLAFLCIACGLIYWGVTHELSDLHQKSRATVSMVAKEAKQRHVGIAVASLFALIAFLGLGGEQILDARLKLSLRTAQSLGAVAPMAIHHAVTIGARLAAYVCSGPLLLNSRAMILVWFCSQCLRLAVLRSFTDISTLPLVATGSLIALDKWSGSLGEIAIEASLLRMLSTSNQARGTWLLDSTFLMGIVGPLEALNASASKMIARSTLGTSIPLILTLSLVPVASVWRLGGQ